MIGAKRMTAAEREHIGRVKATACLACQIEGVNAGTGSEAHHLLSGGRRIGHMAVVALCPWHHRAVPLDRWTAPEMRAAFGPSLMDGSKPFRARYGTDAELLEMQRRLLERAA
jgi:hypothetical protein